MERYRPRVSFHGAEYEAIKQMGQAIEGVLPEPIVEVRRMGEQAIALILGGGGALAPVHIGALARLLECGVRISIITGTSAGAIGAVVASLVYDLNSWLMAKELGKKVTWDELKINGSLADGGIWITDKLAEYIDEKRALIGAGNPNEPIPAMVTMTDITHFPKNRLRVQWAPMPGTTWGEMVQASCCVPVWMAPTRRAGYLLWDGGATTKEGNEPVKLARLITPEAMTISVRLAFHGVEMFTSEDIPDVRIEPCRNYRNTLNDQTRFDPHDIYLGYVEADRYIDQIWRLMDERGIERSYLPGFAGLGRWGLLSYFHDEFD